MTTPATAGYSSRYDSDYSADGTTCCEWDIYPDQWGLWYMTVYVLTDGVWSTDTIEAYDTYEQLLLDMRVYLDIRDPSPSPTPTL